ncbi:MAG TPA: anti-sigma F factor [Bacillota bacterium]|nr:anti-sigma F factor [Bacillota bacterium]
MGGEPRENILRLEFLNLPANIGVARNAIGTFAVQIPFTLDEVDEIRLAVSEAVTNAVVHAYPGDRGWVRVTAWFADGALELTVDDDGCGIPDLAAARAATYTTDPERMGLGFSFMDSFMDQVEVRPGPSGRGTRVLMRKRPTRKDGETASDGDGPA